MPKTAGQARANKSQCARQKSLRTQEFGRFACCHRPFLQTHRTHTVLPGRGGAAGGGVGARTGARSAVLTRARAAATAQPHIRDAHHAAGIAMTLMTLSIGCADVQVHTNSWSHTTSPIVYHATHHRSACVFTQYHTRSAALHTHRNVKERKCTWEFTTRVEHQQC